MKSFLITIAFLSIYHSVIGQVQIYVLVEAKISIHGSTNVNKFECELYRSAATDTLKVIGGIQDGYAKFEGLKLLFSVADFTCDLDLMTRDFREMLDYTNHPFIILDIERIALPKDDSYKDFEGLGSTASISIKDRTRREYIKESYVDESREFVRFGGIHELKITNYGVEPPSKFFGTIVVRDNFRIVFEVTVKKVHKKSG